MVIDGVTFVGQPIPWGHIRDKHFMVTHTWHDGAASKAAVSERPHGHGAYDLGDPYRESLLVSVEGWSWGSTRAEWQRLRNELMALGADKRVVLARLIDGGEDTWRWAQVVKITPKDDRATNRTHWTIDLRAADPRRYGPPITPATQQVPIGGTESNLLANPSFAVNAIGWFGTAQGSPTEYPLARVAHPYDGWLGRIVTGSGAAGLAAGSRIDLDGATVTDVLVDVVGSVATSLRLSLTWLDAAGRALRTDLGAETAAAAYATVRLAMPVTPPAGAARLTLIVDGYGSPWAAGSWLGVHRALVGTATDYRDGDSPGWVWDGRTGASASRKAGVTWLLDNSKGTAPSMPRLEFTPSQQLAQFGVSLSGVGLLSWSGQTIPAGTVVTVDPASRQVLLNGNLPERRWSGTWPEVVAAGTAPTLALMTYDVPATATCAWSPAWW